MISKEWMENYNKAKKMLASPSDYNDYFEKDDVAGKLVTVLDMGTVSIPTGKIIVRDPLVYLDRKAQPYFITTPIGEFPVTACVMVADDVDCDRYAAVKVDFTDEKAVRFENALVGNENIVNMKEGDFYGFNVDAGLGCIADEKVRDAFCDFDEKWNKEEDSKEKNLYDDYFSNLFEESYKKNPNYQREGGDWINWTIPGTDYHMPIFQSGYGDGTYPVYFGFDKNDKVCSLVVEFINIEIMMEAENSEK